MFRPHRFVGLPFVLMAVFSIPYATQAMTLPIQIFNTGVDENGMPLADGSQADPHFQLVFSPNDVSGLTAIRAIGGFPIANSYWIGDDSVSDWILAGQDRLGAPIGGYDYRTYFSIPDEGKVLLVGQWSTDNAGSDILVGGISTGNTTGREDFSVWTPFTISETLSAGDHALDFIVNNSSTSSGHDPTGLRVEFTSATFTPVPESSSFSLLLLAAVGYFVLAIRQKIFHLPVLALCAILRFIIKSSAATITVPAYANPWLAGTPDGTIGGDGYDSSPGQSPV